MRFFCVVLASAVLTAAGFAQAGGYQEAPALAEPRYRSDRTGPIAVPSRYLTAYHPTYASKEPIDKAVKDGKFNSWMSMFGSMADNISNPNVPTPCAWRNIDSNTGAVMRFERNPYYWKVDTAGNQLPYIDSMEICFHSDGQACLLKALAGEVDFQYREIASLTNYPTLSQGADKGGYRLVPAETLNMNQCTNFLNRTTTDPVKSKLYNDLRFRYGLGEPFYVQYAEWVEGIFQGGFGRSMGWDKTVASILLERLPWSFAISLGSFVFVRVIGLPIGLYSATHKYSIGDCI